MRYFVTGASGWIGSAVVPELVDAGHEVTGLARSDEAAAKVTASGATVLRGTVDDLDILRTAAAASDGVIHLAFRHDIAFTGDFAGAVDSDRRAVEAIGDALAGSDRPFVIASGTGGVQPGHVLTERDGLRPDDVSGMGGAMADRQGTAHVTLALADRGVRSSVLRLPPTVHGDGDHGFMATLVRIARDKGVAGYIGDGTNRWPAAHRDDAAHLCCLAVANAPAGSVLHAVADEAVPIRAIAEVIGRHLDIPVASIDPERAGEHFGWLGGFLSLDVPASSSLTRELLGWQPTRPGLLDDLDKGHYFAR